MTTTTSRQGLPTWAWIGIGCAALIFLLMIASGAVVWWGFGKARDIAGDFEANPGLAAARLLIKAHPDVEEVAIDEESGTITVRNTSNGEEITVDFKDVSAGRLSFTSGDKSVTIEAVEDGDAKLRISTEGGELTLSGGNLAEDDRPPWVVIYPGAETANQHTLRHDTGLGGGAELHSDDPVATVADYYRSQLEEDGFSVAVASFSGDDGEAIMITGSDDAGGRTCVVNIRAEEDETIIALTYNEDDQG